MSTGQGLFVGLLIGSLFLLAIVCEPPAFAVSLFGWIRGNFTRGRHHVHAPLPARPFERDRLTVEAIAARLRDEHRAHAHLTIIPDVQGFRDDLRWALDRIASPA